MEYSKRIQDNIDHLVICMMNVISMNQLDTKTIDLIADTLSSAPSSKTQFSFIISLNLFKFKEINSPLSIGS